MAVLTEKSDGDNFFWTYIITMWCAFPFGCATDNMALRKGYTGKFVYGFFFGFFGFLYWCFVPAAWDHPEYIKSIGVNTIHRNHANYKTQKRSQPNRDFNHKIHIS